MSGTSPLLCSNASFAPLPCWRRPPPNTTNTGPLSVRRLSETGYPVSETQFRSQPSYLPTAAPLSRHPPPRTIPRRLGETPDPRKPEEVDAFLAAHATSLDDVRSPHATAPPRAPPAPAPAPAPARRARPAVARNTSWRVFHPPYCHPAPTTSARLGGILFRPCSAQHKLARRKHYACIPPSTPPHPPNRMSTSPMLRRLACPVACL
jgi:hypothetical protein